jgi:hypothetical protein
VEISEQGMEYKPIPPPKTMEPSSSDARRQKWMISKWMI